MDGSTWVSSDAVEVVSSSSSMPGVGSVFSVEEGGEEDCGMREDFDAAFYRPGTWVGFKSHALSAARAGILYVKSNQICDSNQIKSNQM